MSQLSATLTADVSGYKKAIQEAQNVLKGFNSEESATAETLREVYGVTNDQVKAYKKVTESMQHVTDGTKSVKQASNRLRTDIERLRIQWNNLSDTAKKSKFGQSMAHSIRSAESQLKSMNEQMTAVKGATTSASSSMGSLIGIVGKFAPAISAGAAALQVAKDAFFASEENIDDWERAVEGAKGTYNLFLDALNRGDLSYFFRNMGKAKKAMQDIFDLDDKAGSIKQNNSVAVARGEAEVAELRSRLAYDPNNKELQKQLATANRNLANLKLDEVLTNEKSGFKKIVESLDQDVPLSIRESVANGLIKGGEKWMEYANKQVEAFEKGTGQYESRLVQTGYDPNGMPLYFRQNVEKQVWELNKTNTLLYKAYKSLIGKESAELRVQGLAQLADAERSKAAISQQTRKIAGAVTRGGGSGKVEGKKEDPMRLLNEALESRFSNNKIDVQAPVVPVLDEDRLQETLDEVKKQTENVYEGISKKDLAKQALGDVGSINSSLMSTVDTLQSFSEMENPFQVFDGLIGIAQNIMNVCEMADSLSKTMRTLAAVSKVTTMQEVSDSLMKAEADGTEAAASTAAAVANTYEAHSALPWVGVAIASAMVGAMIASIVASKSKVPKFAKGGIISGPTLGLMGEYGGAVNNPEVVAPLDKLRGMLADNDMKGGNVRFEIEGRTLVGLMKKENNLSSRR